jgi:arylformamidase
MDSTTIWDLSMPIADHFRWKVDRRRLQSFEQGDSFQISWLGWSVHSFTHIDSPRHIDPAGETSSDLDLRSVVGEACVLDLTHVKANEAITRETISKAGSGLKAGDIALLKTGWETQEPIASDRFWKRAPYLTREACEWLLEKEIKALGVDFPQDEPIRHLLDGEVRPIDEFVSHDVLLANGIPLIEYLCNLGSITEERVQLFALPLKIPDSDGCPARVIAMPVRQTP